MQKVNDIKNNILNKENASRREWMTKKKEYMMNVHRSSNVPEHVPPLVLPILHFSNYELMSLK